VWRNADWPASWHISTKSYQWQCKCGCSLTSCPGQYTVYRRLNVRDLVVWWSAAIQCIVKTGRGATTSSMDGPIECVRSEPFGQIRLRCATDIALIGTGQMVIQSPNRTAVEFMGGSWPMDVWMCSCQRVIGCVRKLARFVWSAENEKSSTRLSSLMRIPIGFQQTSVFSFDSLLWFSNVYFVFRSDCQERAFECWYDVTGIKQTYACLFGQTDLKDL